MLLAFCFNSYLLHAQNISLVASNEVSYENTLHTLKLSVNNATTSYNDDDIIAYPIDQKIENFISFVENKKGVLRVTYDNATSTFSILSDKNFKIENLINTNNPINESSE